MTRTEPVILLVSRRQNRKVNVKSKSDYSFYKQVQRQPLIHRVLSLYIWWRCYVKRFGDYFMGGWSCMEISVVIKAVYVPLSQLWACSLQYHAEVTSLFFIFSVSMGYGLIQSFSWQHRPETTTWSPESNMPQTSVLVVVQTTHINKV